MAVCVVAERISSGGLVDIGKNMMNLFVTLKDIGFALHPVSVAMHHSIHKHTSKYKNIYIYIYIYIIFI